MRNAMGYLTHWQIDERRSMDRSGKVKPSSDYSIPASERMSSRVPPRRRAMASSSSFRTAISPERSLLTTGALSHRGGASAMAAVP